MKSPMTPLPLLEQQLFSRTFAHPVIGHLVEWVPTQWLLDMANPTRSNTTDLGNWDKDELVDWNALFANIKAQGMRDPFIVGVGRISRKIRLEAGNQRVRCMLLNGVLAVPAVAYVGDSAISHLGNGTHEGCTAELLLPEQVDIMGPYPIKEFRRLSDVLAQMPSSIARRKPS